MENLSIITINLNNSAGLKKTIESVVNQTLQKFEFIIIDGGSTDGSIEIIDHYSDKISYWVSEKDKGIYHAMNKGILQANGKYCFFLNSGDRFVSEDTIEKVFERHYDFDIVYGKLIICDRNNKIIGKTVGKQNITLLDVYNHTIKHQSSFIKRELFNKYGLYNENLKIISDWVFFMKSVGLGDATITFVDTDIAYFDNDGISNHSPDLCIKERQYILKTLLPQRILEDYNTFSSIISFVKISNYKLSRLLLRGLNKSVKVYEKIFKKVN